MLFQNLTLLFSQEKYSLSHKVTKKLTVLSPDITFYEFFFKNMKKSSDFHATQNHRTCKV